MPNTERIDDLQLGGLKLIQNPAAFCFGVDAVLLADFAASAASDSTLDMCSGNGIVPILLSAKTNTARIEALELQPAPAELAQRSVELNALSHRIHITCGDAADAVSIYGKSMFDVITCNPPYMPSGGGLINAADTKTIARHETTCTLEGIIAVSAQLLKSSGRLFMVHRPERLVDILTLMRQYSLEPKRLRMVHPSAHKKANIILVEGVRGGGRELKMMPPLYVYGEDGEYSQEIDEIYGKQKENTMKKGTLYLCATPIGNLGDITARCIDTLRSVDLIAAEDTRQTVKLLNHFDISTPMTSYYEHNKREKGDYLLQKLLEGQDIAVVSDAGTPAISDPGEDLVAVCIENDITITSIPGAAACISALILSGLPTGRFCFEGFLSMNRRQRKIHLDAIKNEERTLIFYEAPHKLKNTLADLYTALGDRRISIARELTKRYEEIVRTTLAEAVAMYKDAPIRGEFVLVVEGTVHTEEDVDYSDISIEAHLKSYTDSGMSEMDAIKAVAKDRGMRKNEVYALVKRK